MSAGAAGAVARSVDSIASARGCGNAESTIGASGWCAGGGTSAIVGASGVASGAASFAAELSATDPVRSAVSSAAIRRSIAWMRSAIRGSSVRKGSGSASRCGAAAPRAAARDLRHALTTSPAIRPIKPPASAASTPWPNAKPSTTPSNVVTIGTAPSRRPSVFDRTIRFREPRGNCLAATADQRPRHAR